MAAKVIGCGLISRCMRFRRSEALKIGCGMMTRGEVALIVAQKGLGVGLLDAKYFTSVILLILCSSIATPIILKYLYTKWPEAPADAGQPEAAGEAAVTGATAEAQTAGSGQG